VLLNLRDIVFGRSPSDRQHRPFSRRRSTCLAAIAIVAALLNLATPTTAAAQGTGAAAQGPASGGQGQLPQPGSSQPFLDSVNVDLGYTYDDNVTLGRTHDEILWDQSLALDQQSYVAGQATFLQVLQSQRLYQQGRLGYARARGQRYQDTVQLFLALRGGWQQAPEASP
jgi:hypothetical protein